MIFEPILFGVTGTQIKIDELESTTVYLCIACLGVGIVIRIIVTVLVGIRSKLNLKEKIFIAFACMAKATVQAALGPVTLDEIDHTQPDQVRFAETTLTLCVISILLTAPAGAIIISLSGPKLLTKTTEPVVPPEGWRTRRPSIRDISIINEDPDLEETADDGKPWRVKKKSFALSMLKMLYGIESNLILRWDEIPFSTAYEIFLLLLVFIFVV